MQFLQSSDPDVENITFTLNPRQKSYKNFVYWDMVVVVYFKPGAKKGLQLNIRQFGSKFGSNQVHGFEVRNLERKTRYLSIHGDEPYKRAGVHQWATFTVQFEELKRLVLSVFKWKYSFANRNKMVYQPGLLEVTP